MIEYGECDRRLRFRFRSFYFSRAPKTDESLGIRSCANLKCPQTPEKKTGPNLTQIGLSELPSDWPEHPEVTPEERERQGMHPHTSTIPKDRQARAHHSPPVSYVALVTPARLPREQVGALPLCTLCAFRVYYFGRNCKKTHGAKAPLQPLCTPRTHTLRRRGGQGLTGAPIV